MPIIQPLPGHFSTVTAYVQADHPYGFRLRCQRLCWLERDARRGYRFCTQTTNPKVAGERWNAPKKSTYTMLAVMGTDEEGHTSWTGCSIYDFDKLEAFQQAYGAAFGPEQRDVCGSALAAYRGYKDIKARATIVETK